MSFILSKIIKAYQLCLSPFLGPCCRFYPSCSNYALEALRVHGALKGSYLAGLRILRCGPWSKGGVDFVPEKE